MEMDKRLLEILGLRPTATEPPFFDENDCIRLYYYQPRLLLGTC